MVCIPSPPDAGFLRSMIDFIDCQAQTIGARGYAALGAQGSSLSLVLTGLLVLFVALFGYRMLFGHTPSVRDGVLALVKIGVVLALATAWPAYRTLVYDVALKGPAELSGAIGGASGLPGATGGLVNRLDYTDRAFVALEIAGPGPIVYGAPPGTVQGAGIPPPIIPGFDVLALGSARVLYLVGVLGALAAVRLVAGLMLALGPFFIAFLLFDSTRGLFEGWIRVLGGAFLGALGIAVVLGVELALLEPWLTDLLARRAASIPIPGAPTELLVVSLVFTLALLAILIAAARLAFGFRMPTVWRTAPAQFLEVVRGGETRVPLLAREGGGEAPAAGRSRAAMVVDAVAASQRREALLREAAAGRAAAGAPGRGAPRHILEREVPAPATVPIGQSFRRRTRSRISPGAGRRDMI
ncbi:MAG TPA: type IV secretion system protein [Allosphingosinicella sp.]